jgi:hypothetical protein
MRANAGRVKGICLSLGSVFFAGAVAAQDAQPQLNPPPPVGAPMAVLQRPAGPSLVAVVRNSEAMSGFEENPAVTRRMVDAVVKAATGRATVEDAWRSLATPADRVGIKVTANGGRYFSTRRGVAQAVVEGLKGAGVPAKNIFIWDRDAAALKDAGFTEERMGCEVRGIAQPKDWDRQDALVAPALGQLIWGDLQFAERVMVLDKSESDQLSSKSHLCTILSKEVTRWINIPAVSDAPGMGIHGAFYSAVVSNIDNWRRFTTSTVQGGSMALADLYADPRIGGKCVLHILDALTLTYAGGPAANPLYTAPHATLYASRDPVALDATGIRLLDQYRQAANLPVLGTKSAWIQTASGVGNFDETMIRFTTVK